MTGKETGKEEKKDNKKMKKAIGQGVINVAMVFVIVAFLAFAIGITFGLLDSVQTTTNGTISIPSEFQNTIHTSQSYAGLGLQIILVVGVLGAIMLLLGLFGVSFTKRD